MRSGLGQWQSGGAQGTAQTAFQAGIDVKSPGAGQVMPLESVQQGQRIQAHGAFILTPSAPDARAGRWNMVVNVVKYQNG